MNATLRGVYDCGQHKGEVYLAMEYIEGTTLRAWQEGAHRDRRSVLSAYAQAAGGLAAAHDLGIVHRDFKPDNVLVAKDGRILVGDFGLAGLPTEESGAASAPFERSKDEHANATRPGALLGTLAYMAPEQLRGDVATPLSDQFAFCTALWEALTGQRPFAGEEREELLEQIERGQAQGADLLPRKLCSILSRGLSEDPERRLPDLRALVDAIRPRRGKVLIGVVLLVGIAAGLVSREFISATLPPSCDLGDAIVEIREIPEWDRLGSQLADQALQPAFDRLSAHLDRLERDATALCKSADDGVQARRQHLEIWTENLVDFLETSSGRSTTTLLDEIEQLESFRLHAPPPKVLDSEVVEALQKSRTQERKNDLEKALEHADQAILLADEDVELTRAHQRRGRILALLGRNEEAMDAYLETIYSADAAVYDDARLDAELLAAKTATMRLEDLSRGSDALERAEALLQRLHEPWMSPRRADYHELLASVLKRDGELDSAIRNQWAALIMRGWLGDLTKIGLGHLNLGTTYERRYDPNDPASQDKQHARIHYERAVEIFEPTQPSPEWFQAVFDLGHWLAQEDAEKDWVRAEELLEKAKAGGSDISIRARTDLVLLATMRENAAAAIDLAKELADALSKQSFLSDPRRLDAWMTISAAYALAGQLDIFESARRRSLEVTARLLQTASSAQATSLEIQMAALDLTAAEHLEDGEPQHAAALANSARKRLLLLPEGDRPAEMLKRAEELSLLDFK